MDYEVELDPSAGRDQSAEALVVRWADGREEHMRLHEYTRVYRIAGLYEEVVQHRLACASPAVLADALVGQAAREGTAAREVRVFDLGAGNGVVGEELGRRGVEVLVGSDNIAEARDAAERDRPGLYADYLVGEVDELLGERDVVVEHGLNALVCAGALGLGHITAASFARLWDRFSPGSWFVVSVHEDLAAPGGSDFGDLLASMDAGRAPGAIVSRRRFRHRLTMSGEPIHYDAVVARKTG
jgi:hypothetical protein